METEYTIKIKLDEWQALEALCKALHCEAVLEPDIDLKIEKGWVWIKKNGEWEKYDERADLHAALRNVICAITPNCDFRSGSDITHYDDERDY